MPNVPQLPGAANMGMATQNRPRGSIGVSPLSGLPNPMSATQAQMMHRAQGQVSMGGQPSVDLALLQQAQQVQQMQQRQIQQQGQNGQMYSASPPRANNMQRPSYPNMMQPPPAFTQTQAQAQNSPKGVSTPPAYSAVPMQQTASHSSQGSPSRTGPHGMPVMTPAIEAQIRQKNPGASDAEVLRYFKAAVENKSFIHTAMGAAAGNGTPRLSASIHPTNGDAAAMSPHQAYAQMLAAQQRQQRESVSSATSTTSNNTSNGGQGKVANVNGNGSTNVPGHPHPSKSNSSNHHNAAINTTRVVQNGKADGNSGSPQDRSTGQVAESKAQASEQA